MEDKEEQCYKILDVVSPEHQQRLQKTGLFSYNFHNNSRLTDAVPGTRLYQEIVSSTPMRTNQILTRYFKVDGICIAYLQ